jgi:hypothetical protein
MEFIAVLFENQPVYEWDCFPEDSLPSKSPTWDYSLSEDLAETHGVAFFKEWGFEFRGTRAWVIQLWFGELTVDQPMGDRCSVAEFIEEYSFLLDEG